MKLYTRTGDSGQTSLASGERTSKASPRIAAYGALDELNSHLGLAVALGASPEVAERIRVLQDKVFRVSCDVSNPMRKADFITDIDTAEIERALDTIVPPPLKAFVLPSGAPAAAALHVARTVCRRAETLVVALDDETLVCVARFLNRVSDYLFALALYQNRLLGIAETEWQYKA